MPAGNPAVLRRPPGGGVAAGDFLGQQHAQHLSGIPPLGAGGGQHVRCGRAQVRQPHPPHQDLELGRDRRGRRGAHRASRHAEQVRCPAGLARSAGQLPPGPTQRMNRLQSSHRAPCPAWRPPQSGTWRRRARGFITAPRSARGSPPPAPSGPTRRCRAGPSAPHRRRPRRPAVSCTARWSRIAGRSSSANRPAIAASPRASSTLAAPTSEASSTARAILARTRCAPAAAASISHRRAPSPSSRNACSARVRARGRGCRGPFPPG